MEAAGRPVGGGSRIRLRPCFGTGEAPDAEVELTACLTTPRLRRGARGRRGGTTAGRSIAADGGAGHVVAGVEWRFPAREERGRGDETVVFNAQDAMAAATAQGHDAEQQQERPGGGDQEHRIDRQRIGTDDRLLRLRRRRVRGRRVRGRRLLRLRRVRSRPPLRLRRFRGRLPLRLSRFRQRPGQGRLRFGRGPQFRPQSRDLVILQLDEQVQVFDALLGFDEA